MVKISLLYKENKLFAIKLAHIRINKFSKKLPGVGIVDGSSFVLLPCLPDWVNFASIN